MADNSLSNAEIEKIGKNLKTMTAPMKELNAELKETAKSLAQMTASFQALQEQFKALSEEVLKDSNIAEIQKKLSQQFSQIAQSVRSDAAKITDAIAASKMPTPPANTAPGEKSGTEGPSETWLYDQGFLKKDAEYIKKLEAQFKDSISGPDRLEDLIQWNADVLPVFAELQQLQVSIVREKMAALQKRLSTDQIGTATYAEGLTKLKQEFGATSFGQEFPLVQKAIDQGWGALEDTKEQNSIMNQLRQNTQEWVATFQSGVADAIVDGKDLTEVLSNIGTEMQKLALKWALFGGGENSGFDGLLGGFFNWLIPANHSGGIVGQEATFHRSIRIPKFHSGGIVRAGEQLAILKKGEGVFTPAQMAALGGRMDSGVSVSVQVNNSGGGDMSDQQAERLGQSLKDIVKIQVAEALYEQQNRRSSPFPY